MNVMTLVLAGGRERRLSILAAHRPKPALSFAGKYRIIDFALSNTVNSGLRRVAILPDYRPQQLLDHVGLGGPWDLNRRRPNGLFIWQPFRDEYSEDVFRGTAGALNQNLRRLEDSGSDVVLLLSGDQIYTMDYRPLLAAHAERNADLTMGVVKVKAEDVHRFGMVQSHSDGRVREFQEKPVESTSLWGSMGVYVFKLEALVRRLREDACDPASSHDIGLNIVPRMVDQDSTFSYQFDGYWQDVGTLHVYWQTQLALMGEELHLNIHDPNWVIHTRSEERPPVKVLPGAAVHHSLVSNGCVIEGQVINSVLSPGVRVAAGAIVRDSIVMLNTTIEAGAVIDRCVIDEAVVIGAGATVGAGQSVRPNRTEPGTITDGLTVVGTRATIPGGITIGRNCRIDPDVSGSDFQGLEIPSGATTMRAMVGR
ncbi:MAG: glucose-1-phosphate adenylyltransferase [Herpetosiphon sp.]